MPKPIVTISLVVPVYNSAESLHLLRDRVSKTFIEEIDEDYELIFVDDGSSNPETWPTLAALARDYREVRALQLTRNFGRTGAVLAGICGACGEWIVVMDDDLQHRPEDISAMLSKREHDVVLAQFEDKAHGLVARIGSRVVTWLEHIVLGFPNHLTNSPFILIRSSIAKHMLHMKSPHSFLTALYLEVTRDIVGVQATHEPRHYGKTQFSFFRRLKHFMNLLINNTAVLLRGVAVVGITMSLASLSFGCYLILQGPANVQGWTSLMVITLIIGGLILMSLGVSGEYLIRIIRGIESRPSFLLRRETGSEANLTEIKETRTHDL
tara:strand:- start:2056 stop:3027 length:972 start_codon:yes stop_codon:yes gene_type:complete